jgi:hypothetical protein
MPLTGYQLPSPRAIEPPSGEYTLAAKSANPDAFLYSYRNARQLAQGDYDRELQAQHAFALQQQRAQIADEQQKNAIGLLKEPGGGRFLASGTPLGMALGGSSDALTNLAQAGERTQSDIDYKNAMEGANAASQAGVTLPISAFPSMTNLPFNFQQTTPRAIDVANIGANARLGAAQIGANAASLPTQSVTSPPDPNAGGVTTTTTWKGKAGQTPEGAKDYLRGHGALPAGVGNPPPATSLQPRQPMPPPAKTDTSPLASVPEAAAQGEGATAPAQPPAAASADAGHTKAVMDKTRQLIEQNKGTIPPQVYQDLQDGMKLHGGNPIFRLGSDGKMHLYGAKGGPYS